MKTGTFNLAEIKDFEGFRKVWENMRECTPEEEKTVFKIISDIKMKKDFDGV